MNANELDKLMRSDGGVPGREWPPRSEGPRWERVRYYRRRLENDPAALWPYATHLHVPEDADATAKRFRDYTPAPIARDLARFSAQLLFSEEPELTAAASPEVLTAWSELNRLHEFLQAAGELVAATGEAGIRIVRDDRVSRDHAIIGAEPADRIIWSERHGRFTVGGVAVVEVDGKDSERFRLLEHHGLGFVKRVLFKGDVGRLGRRVDLQSRPEFADLRPEEETGLERPTLVRWRNVPGSAADIAGLEALLNAADEGETIFRQKARASKALTFAHRRLASTRGDVDLDGVILLGEDQVSPVEAPEALAQVVQGEMHAADHEIYMKHLRELALTGAGYSLSSFGLDHAGGAESGRALRLRQSRTLLTRASKERMAVRAIVETAEISLALKGTTTTVGVKLGDGIAPDRMDLAEELATLRAADAMSTHQAVRELHPDWTEAQVTEEARRIEPPVPGISDLPFRPRLEDDVAS